MNQIFLSDKVARVSNAMSDGIVIYDSTGGSIYLTSEEAQNLCDFLVGKYDLTY
jgi:dihydrodipicolinate synthase/N-acetylneuraminate lyase